MSHLLAFGLGLVCGAAGLLIVFTILAAEDNPHVDGPHYGSGWTTSHMPSQS